MCSVRFSAVDGVGATGEGNIAGVPAFVGGGDFHLAAGSAGIDAADPASTATIDIDREPRPLRDGYDMGADEVP